MLSWETTRRSLGYQNAAFLCTRGRLQGLGLSLCEHTALWDGPWMSVVVVTMLHERGKKNWARVLCFPLSFSLLNLKGTLPFSEQIKEDKTGLRIRFPTHFKWFLYPDIPFFHLCLDPRRACIYQLEQITVTHGTIPGVPTPSPRTRKRGVLASQD